MKQIIFAFVFLFSISVASALYEISYTCQDDICTEGSRVSFNVKLVHYNMSTRYLGISIADQDGNILAINNKVNADVIPDKNVSVEMLGVIPEKPSTYELRLNPCFTFQNLNEDLAAISDVLELCGTDYVSLSVIPLSEISCTADEQCSDDKFCKDNLCKPVLCGYCQYVSEHKCFSYECCNSKACLDDQACINNKCTTLSCAESEYLEDHECRQLQCAQYETFSEHKCVKLVCQDDEYASNRTCKKLECRDNEKIDNHRCVRLRCKDNEYAENHECNVLDCSYFSKPLKHECVFSVRSFLKVLLATLIIVSVLGYLYFKRQEY